MNRADEAMAVADSDPSVATEAEQGSDCAGAQVLRLRTRPGASVRGHALLIGCPLAGLGGVAECLALVQAWLADDYEPVGEPVRSTRAGIEQQVDRMRADIRRGDQVLVYYAGHGRQDLPQADLHDQPVAMLLPMDAREPTPPESRLLPGYVFVEWLRSLACACGADPDEPFAAGEGADGSRPGVTILLECCHAAGLLSAWPQQEAARGAILHEAGLDLAGVDRGGADLGGSVLWVLATGRGEIARGLQSGTVGRMTQALVQVLRDHPGEPWWAVMDRLRAEWNDPTQSPGLVGAESMIPLSGAWLPRPDDWLPCVRVEPCVQTDAPRWRVPLAEGAGWAAGQSVVLTVALAVPTVARGTLVHGEDGFELQVDDDDGPALAGRRLAWACRTSLAGTAVVELWGGDAIARGDVAALLEGVVTEVRDLGSGTRSAPEQGCVGLEVQGAAVVVRDHGGDAVARTSRDDLPAWVRWIERLAAIDG